MRKGFFGFPLYEIAVLVVVAGVILGVLDWRVSYVLEQAERSQVEATMTNLRSALRLEKARRVLAGEAFASLAGKNPASFLKAPPMGYCENFLPEGSRNPRFCPWFYVGEERVLYYAPQRHAHLQVDPGPYGVVLGWKLVRSPMPGNDVELVSTKPYQWF